MTRSGLLLAINSMGTKKTSRERNLKAPRHSEFEIYYRATVNAYINKCGTCNQPIRCF